MGPEPSGPVLTIFESLLVELRTRTGVFSVRDPLDTSIPLQGEDPRLASDAVDQ